MEKEIALINNIIAESIIHGADAGGSYEQNEANLTKAVNEWLKYKGIANMYVLEKHINVGYGWYVHQIVPMNKMAI